jgi:hypothetical protein
MRGSLVLLFALAVGACRESAESGPPAPSAMHGHGGPGASAMGMHGHNPHGASSGGSGYGPLHEVAAVHGEAGPWAVAGYRMGKHALERLGIGRQSFDLDVAHASPRSPQFACIADGASAATGASLGKLNLSFQEADEANIQTTYRRKSTGQVIVLRPAKGFAARFAGVPREKLHAAGAEVLGLRDDEIFEEVKPASP